MLVEVAVSVVSVVRLWLCESGVLVEWIVKWTDAVVGLNGLTSGSR